MPQNMDPFLRQPRRTRFRIRLLGPTGALIAMNASSSWILWGGERSAPDCESSCQYHGSLRTRVSRKLPH